MWKIFTALVAVLLIPVYLIYVVLRSVIVVGTGVALIGVLFIGLQALSQGYAPPVLWTFMLWACAGLCIVTLVPALGPAVQGPTRRGLPWWTILLWSNQQK